MVIEWGEVGEATSGMLPKELTAPYGSVVPYESIATYKPTARYREPSLKLLEKL